jgi:hypothetical protein
MYNEDNIKLGQNYMLYKRAEWIYLVQNRDQRLVAFANAVMNCGVPHREDAFLIS